VNRIKGSALSILLCAVPVGACTAIAPKNPVKASEVCGYAQDPVGGKIADLEVLLGIRVAKLETGMALAGHSFKGIHGV
jgi:hypothetical protein